MSQKKIIYIQVLQTFHYTVLVSVFVTCFNGVNPATCFITQNPYDLNVKLFFFLSQ